MAGDRNGLQIDDARRVVGRRGGDGVHGGDDERVGDAVRQMLCRARREVRSFDNRRARRTNRARRQQPARGERRAPDAGAASDGSQARRCASIHCRTARRHLHAGANADEDLSRDRAGTAPAAVDRRSVWSSSVVG
ncbi:hypothetical protein C6T65_19785 [Burkholderia vietnamiensis]|uniref:Uncharacterized protein n=1 Tax=Burkholderia vietnamiensis TaxID=60552 RepID=A0AA44XZD8_BURVI|nr:hypothetical protein C6T65_19785 [Burkholderia vietnamiensis]RQM53833.1 hypothetical protein EHZ18_23725 [Burkholderia vietnamiensis]